MLIEPTDPPPLAPPSLDDEADQYEADQYEAEAAMLNDPSVVSLGDAPPIGGYTPGYGVEDSRTASWAPSVGRPVSPPLWEHAAAMPEVQQLAVWLEIEGRPEYIGASVPGAGSTSSSASSFRRWSAMAARRAGTSFVAPWTALDDPTVPSSASA